MSIREEPSEGIRLALCVEEGKQVGEGSRHAGQEVAWQRAQEPVSTVRPPGFPSHLGSAAYWAWGGEVADSQGLFSAAQSGH